MGHTLHLILTKVTTSEQQRERVSLQTASGHVSSAIRQVFENNYVNVTHRLSVPGLVTVPAASHTQSSDTQRSWNVSRLGLALNTTSCSARSASSYAASGSHRNTHTQLFLNPTSSEELTYSVLNPPVLLLILLFTNSCSLTVLWGELWESRFTPGIIYCRIQLFKALKSKHFLCVCIIVCHAVLKPAFKIKSCICVCVVCPKYGLPILCCEL